MQFVAHLVCRLPGSQYVCCLRSAQHTLPCTSQKAGLQLTLHTQPPVGAGAEAGARVALWPFAALLGLICLQGKAMVSDNCSRFLTAVFTWPTRGRCQGDGAWPSISTMTRRLTWRLQDCSGVLQWIWHASTSDLLGCRSPACRSCTGAVPLSARCCRLCRRRRLGTSSPLHRRGIDCTKFLDRQSQAYILPFPPPQVEPQGTCPGMHVRSRPAIHNAIIYATEAHGVGAGALCSMCTSIGSRCIPPWGGQRR